MDIYDFIPLYKILCITIFLLVPLLPAWFLYVIAPKERILARGTFAGFKINATGAVAVFIILFASIYFNISEVNKSIDNIENDNKRINALFSEVDSLKRKIPWNLQCQIKIFKRDIQDIDDASAYNACLVANSIQTWPLSLRLDPNKRIVSFYVDDDVLKANENSYSITLPGGYGTKNLRFDPTKEDSATKTIFKIDTVYKNSNDPNLRGNRNDILKGYDKDQGIEKLPNLSTN